MEFTSNDRMVAFGDTKAVIFEGAQKPQAIAEIPMDEKTKSIFYNEHYIGIVTGNEDEAVTNHLAVYDENGKLAHGKGFRSGLQQYRIFDPIMRSVSGTQMSATSIRCTVFISSTMSLKKNFLRLYREN